MYSLNKVRIVFKGCVVVGLHEKSCIDILLADLYSARQNVCPSPCASVSQSFKHTYMHARARTHAHSAPDVSYADDGVNPDPPSLSLTHTHTHTHTHTRELKI